MSDLDRRELLARLDLALLKNRRASAELDAAISDQDDVQRRLRIAMNDLRSYRGRRPVEEKE